MNEAGVIEEIMSKFRRQRRKAHEKKRVTSRAA